MYPSRQGGYWCRLYEGFNRHILINGILILNNSMPFTVNTLNALGMKFTCTMEYNRIEGKRSLMFYRIQFLYKICMATIYFSTNGQCSPLPLIEL